MGVVTAPTVDAVVDVIRGYRYTHTGEAALRDAVAATLAAHGWEPEVERRLSDRDRVDVLVGRVAVECKTAGTWQALARQAQRYAHSDAVDGIVVVTTKAAHLTLPDTLAGVPVRVHFTGRYNL